MSHTPPHDLALEPAMVAALRVDARLLVGWDADRGAYGLYDRDTQQFLAHGAAGQQLGRVDFVTLRARLLLRAIDPATLTA